MLLSELRAILLVGNFDYMWERAEENTKFTTSLLHKIKISGEWNLEVWSYFNISRQMYAWSKIPIFKKFGTFLQREKSFNLETIIAL